MHLPDPATFRELARQFTLVPVYRILLGDTFTPVTAFRRIQSGTWAFLFESVIGGERVGRYSFVGSEPFLLFQAWDRRVTVEYGATVQEQHHPDPLRLLEEYLQRYRAPHLPGLPRFCGGAVGYAAYDAVRYTEYLPHPPPDDRGLPDLCFAFYDRMVIFDHINKTIAVVAMAHINHRDAEASYRLACQRVDELVKRLSRPTDDLPLADIPPQIPLVLSPTTTYPPLAHAACFTELGRPVLSNFTKEQFCQAVRRCQEYICAGDAFQIVLSQRWHTQSQADPFDLYRVLRVVNPSPFMFYLRCGGLTLVGSSPEIMVRVEGDEVTIRPLAGTRPRGTTEEEDRRLAEELLADPKERAEHVMLVDLGRNDIGRVAIPGTVQLSDLMVVERYSHVMHITSNVSGRLQPGKTALDALRACLPAGTVSGAPKVRAMQIIDELEPHRRGPYAGAVGYLDFSGNMDTCIALRTMVILGPTVYIQAGAGIVYDSVPEREYEETMNKALALLRTIAVAEQQLCGRGRLPQSDVG
ncbi:MAG: anthranilate synthase component I [Gemmatales bacterium]|nr:anthranilate synthase component I [Gemmatales bacterium]MDW8174127.1 anthranilate synthase component I [Gemmatales bacterium]